MSSTVGPNVLDDGGAAATASIPAAASTGASSDVRAYAVSIAQRVVNLGANPASPVAQASYAAFIAPGETAQTQASMCEMSGCGLTVAGIWRATGVTSSQLYAPYVVGTAISRLMNVAQAAGAWVPYSAALSPSPGDMVLLDEDGADTHVYTVITITPTQGGYALTSVDGGQVDEDDDETILLKSRTWQGGEDTVAAEGENPVSTRPISGWIDLAKLPVLATPPLWGYVQDGPSGTLGFDTDTALTSGSTGSAAAVACAGYRFCVRYLSLESPGSPEDLTRDEAQGILDAGLGLMAVQHALAPGWSPTASLGTSNGAAAAANATAAGLPMATNLWLDMEGVAAGTTAAAAASFANAWFTAVAAAGFTPGIYVGDASGFTTSAELYQDLSTAHYWSSASSVPGVEGRGYQMIQKDCATAGGVSIDPDVTQTDEEGGQVMWLVTTPVLPPAQSS